jgi:hypothetical protein
MSVYYTSNYNGVYNDRRLGFAATHSKESLLALRRNNPEYDFQIVPDSCIKKLFPNGYPNGPMIKLSDLKLKQ